jgi:sugar/nucleoside kinase (ribokinase family)
LKLSLRVPPTTDVDVATAAVKSILEAQAPHGATVSFSPDTPGPGWESPPCAEWLHDAMNEASSAYFGQDAAWMGEGGSIPFMGMLGEKSPQAQFLVTEQNLDNGQWPPLNHGAQAQPPVPWPQAMQQPWDPPQRH